MKFKNAPLVKVVAKATLREPHALVPGAAFQLSVHMRDRYSSVQDLVLSEQPPGRAIFLESPSQIQGLYYAAADRPTAATVQPDMISSRWQRQAQVPDLVYPGFSFIADDLVTTAEAVANTWSIEASQVVSVAQLSYTDLIVAPGATLSEVAEIYLSPALLPAPTNKPFKFTDMNYGWNIGAVDLRLTMSPGLIRPEGTSEAVEGIEPIQAITLDWVAGKTLEEGQDLRSALSILHDEIETLFVSSITEYAKQEWGYVEPD